MAEERALLDETGLHDRPWFRHLVYAPLPSYDAETLPGLREALLASDVVRARQEAERLGQAIDRALAALRQARPRNFVAPTSASGAPRPSEPAPNGNRAPSILLSH